MSGISALYPSSAQPAAAAPPVASAPVVDATAPPEPVEALPEPHIASEDPDGVDSDGGETDLEAEKLEEGEPVDLTLDEREDFFADVRQNEPPPTSAMDYSAIAQLPGNIQPSEGYLKTAAALAKEGVGQTAARALKNAYVEYAIRPNATTVAGCRAALQDRFGDRAAAKEQSADAFAAALAIRDPDIYDKLKANGMNRDPRVIAFLASLGERRGL